MDDRRVAILVDGENLSVDAAGFLVTTTAKSGVLGVMRVFGTLSRLADRRRVPCGSCAAKEGRS